MFVNWNIIESGVKHHIITLHSRKRHYLVGGLKDAYLILLIQNSIISFEQDFYGARSLTEIYIIIFLQKLIIFENTPKNMKNLNKMSMAKAMGPFRDSGAPSWLSVTQTDVPAKPPLIESDQNNIPTQDHTHFKKNLNRWEAWYFVVYTIYICTLLILEED